MSSPIQVQALIPGSPSVGFGNPSSRPRLPNASAGSSPGYCLKSWTTPRNGQVFACALACRPNALQLKNVDGRLDLLPAWEQDPAVNKRPFCNLPAKAGTHFGVALMCPLPTTGPPGQGNGTPELERTWHMSPGDGPTDLENAGWALPKHCPWAL